MLICGRVSAVENYFNYFTEIEERFQRRRGTVLLLSTLDWALIETWKDAGIPLEAVLRGIDAAFDRWESRPSKTRKVNSLAYCSQEVLAAAEDMKEAEVGSQTNSDSAPGMDATTVAAFFKTNADKLCAADLPDSVAHLARDNAAILQQLAASLEDAALPNLEELERRLTVMEEKLFAALLSATQDDEIVAIRADADRQLVSYRSKMSGAQIEQLQKQFLQKHLLDKHALPRLSLFYM